MVMPMDDTDPALPEVPPGAPVRPLVERDRKGRRHVRWRTRAGQYASRDTTPEEAERIRLKCLEANRRQRPPEIFTDFKVDSVINHLDLRAEYETLMQRPGIHATDLQRWLEGHGHWVCISAIRSHRAAFFKRIADIDETARLAEQFARIGRKHGSGSLAEAASTRYEQLFFKKLFHLSDEEAQKLEMKDWHTMQRVAAGMATSRKFVEEMRLEFQARARLATKEVELALSGKTPGELVCDRVREILGIPLGDDDQHPPVQPQAIPTEGDREVPSASRVQPPAAVEIQAPTAEPPRPENEQRDPPPAIAPPPSPLAPTAIHPSQDRPKPRYVPFELSGW